MTFSMHLSGKKKKGAGPVKQYGLTLMKKDKKQAPATALSAFHVEAVDASASTMSAKEMEKQRVTQEAARAQSAVQVAQAHAQALAEDPSVFDYDGVYDDLRGAREQKLAKQKAAREQEKKQPKYIHTLMEKAKIREIEHERIRERRLLKERVAEDALYGDKEKLISASYKRKLMEMKKWDEADARQDAIEDAEDVTKRGEEAMAGFYSNLLTKNLAMGGTTSHAKSAYTVRDVASAAVAESGVKEPAALGKETACFVEQRVEGARDGHDDAAAPTREAPVEVKLKQPEHGSSAVTALKPSSEKDTQPVQSKEDKLAAAKARFLARKAQRTTTATTAPLREQA